MTRRWSAEETTSEIKAVDERAPDEDAHAGNALDLLVAIGSTVSVVAGLTLIRGRSASDTRKEGEVGISRGGCIWVSGTISGMCAHVREIYDDSPFV